MGLVEEGNADAGVKGNQNEYAYYPTSRWTQFLVDLRLGTLLNSVNLIEFPGTNIPMKAYLTYSTLNSTVDIGLGKGWTSNLHSCVSEDTQTHDLSFITETGAKFVFTWDSNNSKYINPHGFTGFAAENQDGTYTIQTLNGTIFHFFSNGKLASLASLAGGLLNVGYDGSGRPITLTDAKSSRAITLTWSTGGKVTGITDNMSNTWTLTYDGNDNLSQIKQPTDESPDPDIHTSFGYDSNHKMTSQTDFEGLTYDITYHTSGYQTGKIATFIEPTANDATTEFLYEEDQDGFDKKTTLTDGEDRETRFYFSDTSNHLEKISMGSGTTERKTEYDYNSLGLVSAVRDSYGKEIVYSYDTVGHVTSITFPPPVANGTAFVQEFTYTPPNDVLGKLTSMREKVTSSVWATTSFVYGDQDAPYSPSSITDPLNQTTTIDYNTDKQPTSITSATTGGTKTTTIEYDTNTGNAETVTDSEGNETTISYNNNALKAEWTEYEEDLTVLNSYETEYDPTSIPILTTNITTDQEEGLTINHNGLPESATYYYTCISFVEYIDNGVTFANAWEIIARWHPGGWNPWEPVIPYDPNPISETDTKGHKTSYEYDDSGSLLTSSNYLGQETVYSLDEFGGLASIASPFGELTEYTCNNNGQPTAIEVEGVGTYSLSRNDLGQVTSIADPIKGTLSYTYNVRGDVLTSPTGSYSLDILGRTTDISFTGGGSDSISYTPDGILSSLNNFSSTYDTLGNTTSWSDGINSATFSYSGTSGSTKLGLPSSISGSGDIGSYSYTYNFKHWLSTLTDTGKNKTFTFAFNEDKTLASIQYPNQTTLAQTYENKYLDTLSVSKGQDTYLTTDSNFNEDDQRTGYDTSVFAGQNTTFSETNTVTYDTLHRISSLEYGSSSKTLTYSYNTTVGELTSIFDSVANDSYDFSYDTKGRISSVTYPGTQGSSGYTYDDTSNQGKLEEVTYPGNRTMNLTWDGRDRITQVSLDDDGTTTDYYLSFNDLNQIKTLRKAVDGLTEKTWNFSYGPMGIEKATVKNSNNQVVLTQDYTVDSSGTILSMTYTPTGFGGSFAGELYMHYDNLGNLVLMTDSTGNPQVSYAYDMNTMGITDCYNPNGIENLITIGGKSGNLTIPKPWSGEITILSQPGQLIEGVPDGYVMGMSDGGTGPQPPKPPPPYDPCGEEIDMGGDDGHVDLMGKNTPYHNCIVNCFAGGKGIDISEPTLDEEGVWKEWNSTVRNTWDSIIDRLWGVGLTVSAGIIIGWETVLVALGAILYLLESLREIQNEIDRLWRNLLNSEYSKILKRGAKNINDAMKFNKKIEKECIERCKRCKGGPLNP